MDEVVQYHVGETVMGLQRATLTPGGADAVVYWTLMGGIGALQVCACGRLRGWMGGCVWVRVRVCVAGRTRLSTGP